MPSDGSRLTSEVEESPSPGGRDSRRAHPWPVYMWLQVLQKLVPTRFAGPFAALLRPLRIRARYYMQGHRVDLYPYANPLWATNHGGGLHEARVSRFLLKTVPAGAVLYDVGSAEGWYSLLLAPRCSRILAFDPEDASLLANLRLNEAANVEFYGYWIGSEPGEPGQHTLDELVYRRDFPPPTVLKVDVEGAEIAVLEGSARLLRERQPTLVVVETHTEHLFDRCVALLRSHGYAVVNLGCPKVESADDEVYPISFDLGERLQTTSKTRVIAGIPAAGEDCPGSGDRTSGRSEPQPPAQP